MGHNAATHWVMTQWSSALELEVLNGKAQAYNSFGVAGAFQCFFGCEAAFFPLPEGKFVPPGTSSLDVTPTWTDAPTMAGTKMLFIYRSAADGDVVVKEGVENGKALSIPVDAKDADMPFQGASLWWFALLPLADPAGGMPPGVMLDTTLKVVAKRGAGELPVFADPKDLWNGGTSVPVATYETDWGAMCSLGCGDGWDPKGPGLVPPGATKLVLTVKWDWQGPTKAGAGSWNAVSPKGAEAKVVKDGDSERVFEIAVDPKAVDSPYQQRSSWGFYVYTQAPVENPFGIAPSPGGGNAQITVVAVK
jgi:hypothetical protein